MIISGAKNLRPLATALNRTLIETAAPYHPLTNVEIVRMRGVTAIGPNVIYTVPAGKRALPGEFSLFNPTGGAAGSTRRVTIGGTTYRIGTSQTVGAGVTLTIAYDMTFEAGDIVILDTAIAGMHWLGSMLIFDNTSSPKSSRLPSLIVGNNVVYTCPTTSEAKAAARRSNLPSISLELLISNGSGGALTYATHFVPQGDVVSASNKMVSSALANDAVTLLALPNVIASGMSLVVVSTSAAAPQLVWVSVSERPL